jgi:hypothetical protein
MVFGMLASSELLTNHFKYLNYEPGFWWNLQEVTANRPEDTLLLEDSGSKDNDTGGNDFRYGQETPALTKGEMA